MAAILKVDPEKKKKYLAYAKETVYWEACLEKGERLEQKVTFHAHLPSAHIKTGNNFRIHGKSSGRAWLLVSYSLDGSSLRWLSTKYPSLTMRWPILTPMRFWRWGCFKTESMMTNVNQVSISADKKQIKSQYKKLSLIYHPDKPTGNDKLFMKLKKAYDALTDETARC